MNSADPTPAASSQPRPAASSLPPSDGGGADWADRAGHDIADSVGKGLAASTPLEAWAIKQLGATYAAIIRKHAPTQQPAEQPEALAIPEEGVSPDKWERIGIYGVIALRERVRELEHSISLCSGTCSSESSATPRPESPDAQRGELRDKLYQAICATTAAHENKYDFAIKHASELDAAILKAVSALPAKGPGPRSDTERLDWLDEHGTVAAKYQHLPPASDHSGPVFWKINWDKGNEDTPHLRDAIDAAMDSPPASHSKQREGEQ